MRDGSHSPLLADFDQLDVGEMFYGTADSSDSSVFVGASHPSGVSARARRRRNDS